MNTWEIREGDALAVLRTLAAGSAQTCVTSPPYYGLRDYGAEGQIGLEATPEEYTARLVDVFREVRRVLRDDGTLWLNLGDSYAATGKSGGGAQGKRWEECGADTEGPRGGKWSPAPPGLKPKDMIGIPWRVAFALQADGWYLRSDIIWAKPNPMPESVTDRPTKAHEYIFLLSKSERYAYDVEAVREPWADERMGSSRARSLPYSAGSGRHDTLGGIGRPGLGVAPLTTGRNLRTVWTVPTQPFSGAHFATMPPALVEPCVKAGAPAGALVLDPFAGAGTTGLVALRLGRRFLGIELNPAYAAMARRRVEGDSPLFNRCVAP
jgi:DNA modification methylase